MEPRNKTLQEIGTEDRARECEHAIRCALMADHIVKQQLKIKKLKEKNKRSKERRVAEKSPVTTCIINYLRDCAKKGKSKIISLEEISRIVMINNCPCSICEYVRSMKAAAAGAGHFLKNSHTVSFSPYGNTITLRPAA